MSEKPILFSGPMARAILEGRKTQTRRVVKPQPKRFTPEHEKEWFAHAEVYKNGDVLWWEGPPHGPTCYHESKLPIQPGDRLWVRETWQHSPDAGVCLADCGPEPDYRYAADYTDEVKAELGPWKPSIFMPRWASRITLEVTAVRAERLQDISGEDALAEGIHPHTGYPRGFYKMDNQAALDSIHIDEFRNLWDSINGKKHPWESNPWVWVYEFQEAKP